MIQNVAEPKALTGQKAAPAEVLTAKEADTANLFSRVDLSSLLRRDLLSLDQAEIAKFIGGTTVLITGAGGSLGSALCRQVAQFAVREIIPLDHSGGLAEIITERRANYPDGEPSWQPTFETLRITLSSASTGRM
jgi:FlaA1/EpsC-like NDP-sugar epimerase